ncbi:hypothetical protein JCM10207_003566 [Rhodosporidiobolus poonsookiae]
MRTTLSTALLVALVALLLPHSFFAAPNPNLPPADSPERLKLALGAQADQYVVQGNGAPAYHEDSAFAQPPSPPLMDPLVDIRDLKRMKAIPRGASYDSLVERAAAKKDASPWKAVKGRRGKGIRRVPAFEMQ